MMLACIKTGSDVWGRPAGMSADEHWAKFEGEMREALAFLISNHSRSSNKEYDIACLYNSPEVCDLVSIDPVLHIQDNVHYRVPGYRNIKWWRRYPFMYVFIQDIFWAPTNARDYYFKLKLTMEFSEEHGAQITHKQMSRTHDTDFETHSILIEDESFTYQGHQVNTADEVIELIKQLGDMPCYQALN